MSLQRKVLVTGAGGFIGSALVERLLRDGSEVLALVEYNSNGSWGWLEELRRNKPSNLTVALGDVRDSGQMLKLVDDFRPEVVYHLAALIGIPYSYDAPRSYVSTNISGTLNLLEACRQVGVGRVLHTSTSEVYGTAIYSPIDEEHPLQGQSPYSASKIAADKLAEAYYCSFGVPVLTVRPFNTYGPRQSLRAVIPTIISQALTQPEIRLGSLDPQRDLTYVEDTAAGFIAAASAPADVLGSVVNLGVGKTVSIGDLADRILSLMDLTLPIVSEQARIRPEGSEVKLLCSNNRRAADRLGWAPATGLDEGLSRTIAWMRERSDLWQTVEYVR